MKSKRIYLFSPKKYIEKRIWMSPECPTNVFYFVLLVT